METRLSALFKTEEENQILEKFKGETLQGKTYQPLFPHFANVIVLTVLHFSGSYIYLYNS